MGTRDEEGVIVHFSVQPPELGLAERIADTDTSGATQELLFTGRAERVPDSIQHLVSLVDTPIPLNVLIHPLERRDCRRTGWEPSADPGSNDVHRLPHRRHWLSPPFGFFYARRLCSDQ